MLVNKDFRQIGLRKVLSLVLFVLMRWFIYIYFWMKTNYLIRERKVVIRLWSVFRKYQNISWKKFLILFLLKNFVIKKRRLSLLERVICIKYIKEKSFFSID